MIVKSNFVKAAILYLVIMSCKNYASGLHESMANPLIPVCPETSHESPLGRGGLNFSFSNVPMHASPQDSISGDHNGHYSPASRELDGDGRFQGLRDSATGLSVRDVRHQRGSQIEQAIAAQRIIVASNRTEESLLSEDIFPDLRAIQSEKTEKDGEKDVVEMELLKQDRNGRYESPQTQAVHVSLIIQPISELEVKKKKNFWSCCGSSDDVAAK